MKIKNVHKDALAIIDTALEYLKITASHMTPVHSKPIEIINSFLLKETQMTLDGIELFIQWAQEAKKNLSDCVLLKNISNICLAELHVLTQFILENSSQTRYSKFFLCEIHDNKHREIICSSATLYQQLGTMRDIILIATLLKHEVTSNDDAEMIVSMELSHCHDLGRLFSKMKQTKYQQDLTGKFYSFNPGINNSSHTVERVIPTKSFSMVVDQKEINLLQPLLEQLYQKYFHHLAFFQRRWGTMFVPEFDKAISVRSKTINYQKFPYASLRYPCINFFISIIIDNNSRLIEALITADGSPGDVDLTTDVNQLISKLEYFLESQDFYYQRDRDVAYYLLTLSRFNNNDKHKVIPLDFDGDSFFIPEQDHHLSNINAFTDLQIEQLTLRISRLTLYQLKGNHSS